MSVIGWVSVGERGTRNRGSREEEVPAVSAFCEVGVLLRRIPHFTFCDVEQLAPAAVEGTALGEVGMEKIYYVTRNDALLYFICSTFVRWCMLQES
jgi:hypothetical protein